MKVEVYSKFVHELCKKFVGKGDHVFDCGCGEGSKTKILMQYSNHVIGGDLDNRTIPDSKINFRKITSERYGADNEFDIVLSFDVIEHIENDIGFLAELKRITKPNGVIIVGTPNKNRLSNKITAFFKGEIKYPRKLGFHYESGGDIIHIREYTQKDLSSLAEKCGLNCAEVLSGFWGLYTPIGAIGVKRLNKKILSRYAQHLFLIVKKQ